MNTQGDCRSCIQRACAWNGEHYDPCRRCADEGRTPTPCCRCCEGWKRDDPQGHDATLPHAKACLDCGQAGRVTTPEPGACADPSCPVLHADPANPIHPTFYEPGGPFMDDECADCRHDDFPGWWCSRTEGHAGPCALRPRWWNLRRWRLR